MRCCAVVSALILLSCACGPEPAPSRRPADPVDPAAPALASPEAPPPAAAGRPARCALPVGEGEHSIDVGGAPRAYVIDVGDNIPAAPPPVLFTWHGFGSSARRSLAAIRSDSLWNDAIVVAPVGLPRTFPQFGDTAQLGFQVAAGELEDRDLLLFDAIVAKLTAAGCLDARRVYTTGFSNGGFFSNVLACHRGAQLAGAAPVGGGGPFTKPCGPPVPVLIAHGRADAVVPYARASETFQHWVAHNGCAAESSPPADGCAAATDCPATAAVRLCSHAGGHTWPTDQAQRIAEFLRPLARPSAGQGPH